MQGEAPVTPPPVTPPMMSPIIQCSRVSKSYGETRILEDFDLEVSAGEKLAIIGPSGSGKSTILRLLMGLETYQSGRIMISGNLLPSESEPRRRRATPGHDVGMVFQHFNLFPHMTALENVVEAPVRVLKISAADGRKRARELFKKVGLSGATTPILRNFRAANSSASRLRERWPWNRRSCSSTKSLPP